MPAYRKASIRELATAAYELDSSVVEGRLQRGGENGNWKVGDEQLSEWLNKYEDQEIVLIATPMENGGRPMPLKLCRTCGTEYRGIECPRCRRARTRLRERSKDFEVLSP